MFRQKVETLASIAPIAIDRLRRHATLGAQIGQSGGDFGGNIATRLEFAHKRRLAPLPSLFLKCPESARPRVMTLRVVDILVPVALDQTYSYRVPAELDLAPGDLVAVPLGAREIGRAHV